MKQTACMCISVCLYMWAYICIHTVPVDFFYACVTSVMTLVIGHIPRRESFSATICVPVRTRGTVALGCTPMQIDAHERIFQPFSQHLMVNLPALLLTTLFRGHSM